jgi:hypothetical protein
MGCGILQLKEMGCGNPRQREGDGEYAGNLEREIGKERGRDGGREVGREGGRAGVRAREGGE